MTKNIEAVRPRIGQCGTTVDVSIQGISLSNPREVVFFEPGIRAEDLQPVSELPRRNFAHGGTIVEEVRCRFEIDADCPPGEHAFRLLTATELTCIGTFHVSPFPVIDEGENNNAYSNDSLDAAMPVDLNTTIRGQLGNGAREDRDIYRVQVEAGQRLSVEVDSARIADRHYGDSEFDVALRVLDVNGNTIAANDDNPLHLQDPLVSVKTAQSGPLYVEVRRSIFAPSETEYCVHIGNFRRPLAVFPPGGPAGTDLKVRLLGDPLGVVDSTVAIPDVDGTFFWFDSAGEMERTPSAMKFRSSHYPNVLESESSEQNVVEVLPAALNGIIDSPTDVDAWRLKVSKGQRLHLRVFASSLGSPIDAFIRMRPLGADGEPGDPEISVDDSPLQDHDIFGTSFRGGGGLAEAIDPSLIWEPKQDGEYLLEIRDTSGSGGETGVYRIEIEPPRTVVQTLLASATFDWTESTRVTGLAIPKGNRWTVDLSLPTGQWNALGCDFDLIAHGLPDGVRMISPRVPSGAGRWPVQFEAHSDMKPAVAVFTLEARPVDSSESVESRCQQNVPFINHPGGSAWRTVRTDRYILGVTDPAPFSLDVQQPDVPLVRGGELAIPVVVTRHDGFDGPIEIRCGSLPRSISVPPPTLIPAGESMGHLQLGASSNAPIEIVPLYVVGSTVRDDIDSFLGAGHIRVSSRLMNLSITQPYVELASQPESIRRGEQKEFVWTVRHHTRFEGRAAVMLRGLPKGVTVVEPLPAITTESTTVVFTLEATGEALLGQASGLICEVMIPAGDQQIIQRSGNGALRIDPAVK